MRGFREHRYDILVATDIAARGIDVSGVSHVINFDVPSTPEAYTHRIGRTGRSENEGSAATFVTSEDVDWVRATERMLGSKIERRVVEGIGQFGRSESGRRERPRSGGRAGAEGRGRPSSRAGQERSGNPSSGGRRTRAR